MNHDTTNNIKALSSSPPGQKNVDKNTSSQDAVKDRHARLEDALRANLRKRKKQARARGEKK
mgnify:CR=1 FL=1